MQLLVNYDQQLDTNDQWILSVYINININIYFISMIFSRVFQTLSECVDVSHDLFTLISLQLLFLCAICLYLNFFFSMLVCSNRLEELTAEFLEEKERNSALQVEVVKLQKQSEISEKVKFRRHLILLLSSQYILSLLEWNH